MPPRSIEELLQAHLDRAVIPIDEEGAQLFSEDNPGHISDETTQAALSAQDLLLDEIHEDTEHTEGYLHSDERWWGALVAPTQDNAIDDTVTNAHTLVSGNDDWGVAIPIIGRLDNPVQPWQTVFDIHRVLITDISTTTVWRLRFLYGNESFLEARNALRWTEVMFIGGGVGSNISVVPMDIRQREVPVGWNVWAQGWNATNLAALEFYFGAHGHPMVHVF